MIHRQKIRLRARGNPRRTALAALAASIGCVAIGSLGASPAASGGGALSCTPALNKLIAPHCTRVFADNGTNPSPATVWGSIDCQKASRVSQYYTGGDRRLDSTGKRPADSTFRRVRVRDGDNFWGERCELGRNGSHSAPNVLYHEGQRRITFMSIRLPASFPLGANTWQDVMQMKQTEPAANGSGSPALSLYAFNGHWALMQSKSPGPSSDMRQLWSAPARKGVWTRFAFDVRYSQYADRGSIKVFVDLNRDGDAADHGEQSRRFDTYTLKREIKGGTKDGIAPGESIPSHLRAGIYHDSAIRCPRGGCAVDLDNVQVVRPG